MGHRTEKVELTVLCLIQDGNRILLQNRIKEDWKGYTLPGGHVDRSNLSEIETVNDLEQLLEVIDNPKLTEFQYLVNEDEWTASIK